MTSDSMIVARSVEVYHVEPGTFAMFDDAGVLIAVDSNYYAGGDARAEDDYWQPGYHVSWRTPTAEEMASEACQSVIARFQDREAAEVAARAVARENHNASLQNARDWEQAHPEFAAVHAKTAEQIRTEQRASGMTDAEIADDEARHKDFLNDFLSDF